MGKVLDLSHFKEEKQLHDNFWDPNFITYYYEADIPFIQKSRKEIWNVLWFDYISRLIKIAKKKNTILGKEWERTWVFPMHIKTHLDKINSNDFQKAINLLNTEIKKGSTSIKMELMAIRNYILQKI